MSLPIQVEAYSGYKANERPLRFWLDAELNDIELTGVYEITELEDRWYEPEAEYFKVRTTECKRYILRYNEGESQWTLQSGFDGAELLARPSIEIVAVDPGSIRNAAALIVGASSAGRKMPKFRSTGYLRAYSADMEHLSS